MLRPETSNTAMKDDIMSSILPEELHGDIPSGFNQAGHVGE
jgi:hypothetical protein